MNHLKGFLYIILSFAALIPQVGLGSSFSLNYYGIFLGPSLQRPSTYQPLPNSGFPDPTRPVVFKNFFNMNYGLSDTISLGATGYGTWGPALRGGVIFEDPFLTLSNSSIFQNGNLNLYADIRFHLPMSDISRENNRKLGLQVIQALTYDISDSRASLGLSGSLRTNIYGAYGWGNDLELYLAPIIRYQLNPDLALTLLYEMQASHSLGQPSFVLNNDGTDLQPGISWDITPALMINPYLNLQTGGKLTWRTTSFGVFLSWALL